MHPTPSLGELLAHNAAHRPNSIAVRLGDQTRTFGQLDDRAARLQAAIEIHTEVGDRVAILGTNSLAYTEAMYAVPAAGRALVLLNYRLSPAEWEWILADGDVRMLLVDAAFAEPALDVASRVDGVTTAVVIAPTPPTGSMGYEDLLARARPATTSVVAPDATAFVIYTSGTTGFPKGAMISHRAVVAAARANAAGVELHPDDRFLMSFPMCHAAGFQLFVAHQQGVEFSLMESFDPNRFLALVEQQRITRTSLAPTMAAFVLDQPEFATADLTSVRGCSYGGMPMPVGTARRLAERFPALYTGYGQSESTLLVTGLSPADHRRALAGEPGLLESCGRAYEGVGIELRADDDTAVPAGEVGELCVRSDYTMTGYWNRPDETATALAGGWLHTGDLARQDDDGFVYLVDRKKDLIISGGLNIYPAEVERVLHQLPGVAEVAVVGRPDPVWGERVVAVVVARPDTALSADDVVSHCRASLAAYKAPRDVVFRSDLPKTVTGKYRKPAIRESLDDG